MRSMQKIEEYAPLLLTVQVLQNSFLVRVLVTLLRPPSYECKQPKAAPASAPSFATFLGERGA